MKERDKVVQNKAWGKTKSLPRGLTILHEDADILVVNKPAGLLSMGTNKEKIRTAYHALTNYVRKGTAKSTKRIFIVHRLDRETSGVMIFAKNEQTKLLLQNHWPQTEKKYLAIVHGRFDKSDDTITSYLCENKAHNVYITPDAIKGKLARTAYRVLKEKRDFSLLEITLLTGRKHQIRVQMASISHPVVGDKRYGLVNAGEKRLGLHALSITFPHPVSGKNLLIRSEPPGHFKTLFGE